VYSLALRYLGADVTAIDHFVEYEADCDNQMGTTTEIVALLERHGVRVIRQDFEKDGFPQARDTFDIVLFLAVIEHLHGSPRRVLGGLWQMLRPGGLLVVTTPNHAWIRTRLRLLTGRSVHDPLDRWWREPFHGHVREYTMDELTTMLRLAGFDVIRANISNWVHAASRTVTPAGERWTTRFTLIPPSRLLVLASLVLGFFSERLRYSMLTIGRRPFVEHPAAVSPNTLIRPRRNT
jgi:SAM-dependent methyltransferase